MKFAALALGFGLCPSLFAVSYTWNFAAGDNFGGATGNSLTFSSSPTGGPTVKATAWYIDAGGSFQQAALGQYLSYGLGVCSAGDSTCSTPDYQLDNKGRNEFILFEFSAPVDPSSFAITSPSSADLDASYWLGGSAGQNLNLTGTTVSGLSGLGFGAENDNNGAAGSGRTVDLTAGLPTGNVNKVLFGASYSDANDYFMIASLAGTGNPVSANPEPSSVILLATIGLVLLRLRSKLAVRP